MEQTACLDGKEQEWGYKQGVQVWAMLNLPGPGPPTEDMEH